MPSRATAIVVTLASVLLACSSSPKDSGFVDPNAGPDGPSSSSGGFGGPDGGKDGGPTTGKEVGNTPPCDDVAGSAAADHAKAMGLCSSAATDGFGLVSATFTRGYNRTDAPKAEQHGVLPKFGDVIRPREGKMLTVLSTGYAQEFDGPGNAPFGGVSQGGAINGKDWWGAKRSAGNGAAPPGFPKPSAGCPVDNKVNDVINLKLEIKAPPSATGFKFDFNFYSGEWPAYVCSNFNDGFVAYLTAKGFNGGKADNMSFDKNNNPVSVNNGFFDRCTPNVTTGCASLLGMPGTSVCPGGPGELAGTGFGVDGKWCPLSPGRSTNGGATGWLTSQAPVQGGETFTLELMIWDTGDGVLDSSVLLDKFQWVGGGVVTPGTDRPPS